jgi:hypothetical protein
MKSLGWLTMQELLRESSEKLRKFTNKIEMLKFVIF